MAICKLETEHQNKSQEETCNTRNGEYKTRIHRREGRNPQKKRRWRLGEYLRFCFRIFFAFFFAFCSLFFSHFLDLVFRQFLRFLLKVKNRIFPRKKAKKKRNKSKKKAKKKRKKCEKNANKKWKKSGKKTAKSGKKAQTKQRDDFFLSDQNAKAKAKRTKQEGLESREHSRTECNNNDKQYNGRLSNNMLSYHANMSKVKADRIEPSQIFSCKMKGKEGIRMGSIFPHSFPCKRKECVHWST